MVSIDSNSPENRDDFKSQYERFIEEVIELGVVWNLESADGFAICESEEFDDKQVMPFWSTEKEANAACIGEWQTYKANPVAFDDFVDAWLHGMDEDEIYAGVNWSAELEGAEVEPVILIEDLLAED